MRFIDAFGEQAVMKLIYEELRGIPLGTSELSRDDLSDWLEDLAQLAWQLRKEREAHHGG